MKVSNAFPGKYLKAADLEGRTVRAVIERVELEDVGDDHKPVLYFRGKEKGLVANKTNANTIAEIYGDEMNDWIGQPIEIFPSTTDYQGKRVPCLRVSVPRPASTGRLPSATKPSPGNTEHDELNPPLGEPNF